MLANSVMLNVMHPGRLLPQDATVYLGVDGKTELKGPGWRDPRKWWLQIVDPFDFGGCLRRDPKFDFWNHPEATEGDESMAVIESGAGKAQNANAY
jgi:hypothetical protein